MNVKCLFLVFFFVASFLISCKKVPILPNYDPRSKGKRLSRTWILRKSTSYLPSTSLDNTRVVVSFAPKGLFQWVVYTDVLGVESASTHRGTWRFIEQQTKLVLQVEVKQPLVKCDTFTVVSLSSQRLLLRRLSYHSYDIKALEFGAEAGVY